MILALQSSALVVGKSATRRALHASASATSQRAKRCAVPDRVRAQNGAHAGCIAAGVTLTAFAIVQHRNFDSSKDCGDDFPSRFRFGGTCSGNMRISPFGPQALAESSNNGKGTDGDSRKTAAGWVKEVKRDGLAKFLNETILRNNANDANSTRGDQSAGTPNKDQPLALFGKIKDAVGDMVENVTDAVENKKGMTESTKSAGEGEAVRAGSKDFASLVDVVSGVLIGKSSSNEEAVRNLIDTARENVAVGDVDDNTSLEALFALFQELWITVDKTFAGINTRFDPTALFYFLECEDERKNPSWKRMVHRYMKGVDVRMVNDLFDALQFAHLAYASKETDIRDGLDSFNEKYELAYYEPDSRTGEPSHFLALKKGQSRWNNTLDVILSIRGTDSIEDILTDCLGQPVEYRGGKAHDGFVRSGQHIVNLHKPLLLEMLKMSGKKKIKLRMFGHSLGAATGTIAGIEFNDDERFDVEVVGFGCPASLSKDLSEKYKRIITTVVNDADMIPRMSGSTLVNAAIAILNYDYTPKARRDAEHALKELQSNVSIFIGASDVEMAMGFVDKALNELIRPQIVQNGVSMARIEPELFPPGRCIHFYQDGRSVSGSYAPCTFFDELDVARTMVDDHLIKRGYRRLFLELMREYHDDDHFAFDRKEFDF